MTPETLLYTAEKAMRGKPFDPILKNGIWYTPEGYAFCSGDSGHAQRELARLTMHAAQNSKSLIWC